MKKRLSNATFMVLRHSHELYAANPEPKDCCEPGISFINRHTVALDTLCFLATCVSDIPERRPWTTWSRSILSGERPMCRPSNRARRIPARTRSTIRFFSSSAIAPTMTTIARPNGPPVSICSRKLMNSMLRWLVRREFPENAVRSEPSDQMPRRAQHQSGSFERPPSICRDQGASLWRQKSGPCIRKRSRSHAAEPSRANRTAEFRSADLR